MRLANHAPFLRHRGGEAVEIPATWELSPLACARDALADRKRTAPAQLGLSPYFPHVRSGSPQTVLGDIPVRFPSARRAPRLAGSPQLPHRDDLTRTARKRRCGDAESSTARRREGSRKSQTLERAKRRKS